MYIRVCIWKHTGQNERHCHVDAYRNIARRLMYSGYETFALILTIRINYQVFLNN